jgi:SMC interacting uncharacterized protein involved in chromosome segregation
VSEDAELRHLIQKQEEAITELTERLRTRDRIMEEAIAESESLSQHLKALHMRMLRARFKRA